jgi:hypothetical protein
MSELLAEMEARRGRARKADAPVAAVVAAFAVLVGSPFLLSSVVGPGVADLLGGEASAGQAARAIGVILGLGLAGAAALWALLWFGLVRAARPAWGLPLLAGLAVAGITGFSLSGLVSGQVQNRERQERVAAGEIRAALDAFLKHSLEGDYTVTAAKARGAVGAVEQRIKTDIAALVKATRRYEADLEALVADDDDLDTSRAGLQAIRDRSARAEAMAVAHRKAVKARMVSIRRALRDDLSPWVKRAYLPGYEEEFGVRQGDLDRNLALQEQIWGARKDQAAILLDSFGAWTRSGRAITFRRESDLRKFDAATYEIGNVGWRLRGMDAEERVKAGEFLRRPPVLED